MSYFVDLPTNRNNFSIQLQLIGFYNREGPCFLCAVSAEDLNIIQTDLILLKLYGTTKVGVCYEETSLIWIQSPPVIRGTSVRFSMSVFTQYQRIFCAEFHQIWCRIALSNAVEQE
jgi:hypothetical protein